MSLALFVMKLSLTILEISGFQIQMDASAVRSVVFEHSISDQKITGSSYFIAKIRVSSQTGCAIACNKNPVCLSFNFCNRQTCELNKVDIFSTPEGDKLLGEAIGCKYVGLKKQDRPMCKEYRQLKDIRDDSFPAICEINRKRVDRQWGPGEPIDFDTSTEWRQVEGKRLVLEAAHGGIVSQQPLGRTLKSFAFVYTMLSWHAAKQNCQNIGGSLFHDLDGTTQQLDDLLSRMERGRYWLGFERAAPNSENWKNVDGAQA